MEASQIVRRFRGPKLKAASMSSQSKKKASPAPRLPESSRLIPIVLSGMGALAAYLNTLGHPFVYDDIDGIIQNPVVTGFDSLSDIPAVLLQPWRSIVVLSYALSRYLFGFDARAFHLANVLLHAVNTALVCAIAHEAAKLWVAGEKANRFVLGTGLIFALHPLHSEAVAYVWGRSSSLCGMFYFGSLLAVMIACRKTATLERVLWAVGALMAGFLAWRTKEEAITLPLAVAGFLFLRGYRRVAAGILLAPFLIVLVRYAEIARLFALVGENRRLVLAGAPPALEPGTYLLTHIASVVTYYLAKFVFPFGLNADPAVKTVTTVADAHFILALLCLTGLAIAGIASVRRMPIISFGLWTLLISPLAAYSFMPLADVVAEHRAYIAGLGYAILLASALLWKPRYGVTAVLIVSSLFGIATVSRNRVWADSVSLWRDTEKKSPMLARPHLNLGVAYQGEGRDEEALTEFEHALTLNPRLTPALVNRGAIFFHRGELDRAEAELMKAIEIAPERAAAYLNLASVAMARKQPQTALSWLDKSIALEETPVSRFVRGEILLQLSRAEDAAREYQRAADLQRGASELATRIELRLKQLRERGVIR
jgi:tetratricopeptide (TPR) repeat protein